VRPSASSLRPTRLAPHSAELVATSRVYREQRKEWAGLLAHLPLDPDHMVVLCAYRHRVRAAHSWTDLPLEIEEKFTA
jgi:hypothetical protein